MKTRPTIAPDANRDRPHTCQFCGQPLQVAGAFLPDRYGGRWEAVKPCGCPGVAEARQASAEFRRNLGMR